MIYTVLLTDGTVGKISAETVSEGDTISVALHDENGMQITAKGVVDSILEENEDE